MEVKNDEFLIFNEPINYIEPIFGIDYKKWIKVMKSEMDFMYTSKVWTLVDPLEGIKPFGCKWVVKKNTNMNYTNVQS